METEHNCCCCAYLFESCNPTDSNSKLLRSRISCRISCSQYICCCCNRWSKYSKCCNLRYSARSRIWVELMCSILNQTLNLLSLLAFANIIAALFGGGDVEQALLHGFQLMRISIHIYICRRTMKGIFIAQYNIILF